MNLPDLIPTGRRPPQAAREETAPPAGKPEIADKKKSGARDGEFNLLLDAGADTPAPPVGPTLQALPSPLPADAAEPALPAAGMPEIAAEGIETVTAESELPVVEITPQSPDPEFVPAGPDMTPPSEAASAPQEITARIGASVPAVGPPAANGDAPDAPDEPPELAAQTSEPVLAARDVADPVAPAKPVTPSAGVQGPEPATTAAVPEPEQIEGDDGSEKQAAPAARLSGDARPATPAAVVNNAPAVATEAPRAMGEFQVGGWRLAADASHGTRHDAVQQAAVSPHHVAGQITLAIAAASEGSVEIRLDPPELGRVQIRLDPSDNGVRAVVMAERPETQDLLRRNSETLARDLTEAGYSSVSLEFSAGGQSAQQRDERLAQFTTSAPVTLAARGDISIEPPRQTGAGRLDIRL